MTFMYMKSYKPREKLPLSKKHKKIIKLEKPRRLNDLIVLVHPISCMGDVENYDPCSFERTIEDILKNYKGPVIVTEPYNNLDLIKDIIEDYRPKGPRYILSTDYTPGTEKKPGTNNPEPIIGWPVTTNFIDKLKVNNITIAGGYLANFPNMCINQTFIHLKSLLQNKIKINKNMCLEYQEHNILSDFC